MGKDCKGGFDAHHQLPVRRHKTVLYFLLVHDPAHLGTIIVFATGRQVVCANGLPPGNDG